MASRTALAILLFGAALPSQQAPQNKMVRPRFESGDRLLRPEGYREWIFAGSSLGMGYTEGAPAKAPEFHNIYLQPEAWRQFRETGRFPDQTMLVMERLSSATNASINRQGHFQDRLLGIEVAVKDEARFPEKWAYFNLGASLPKAQPFPKEACWNCHHQHGAADNVFVQFYPVLRK